MKQAVALAKMVVVPEILKAAELLKFHGLIEDEPTAYVKRYIKANPEIQELINNNLGITP